MATVDELKQAVREAVPNQQRATADFARALKAWSKNEIGQMEAYVALATEMLGHNPQAPTLHDSAMIAAKLAELDRAETKYVASRNEVHDQISLYMEATDTFRELINRFLARMTYEMTMVITGPGAEERLEQLARQEIEAAAHRTARSKS